MAHSKHIWQFFRAGGFDQVQLSTGADLLALDELDLKLWVALACPTTGLEFDQTTLALIDTDKDGRVRANELITAVKWTGSLLKNPDLIVRRVSALPLDAINDATPEGKAVLASARTILGNLGKPNATEITLADTADTVKIFAQTAFNGDGIIVAEAAEDPALRTLIADIIATQGGLADRSGKPGIDQAKVDAFFAAAAAYDAWAARSEAEAATILPLGDATAAASAALKAVRTKVDDYFGRCRLAAFDPRALAAVNRDEKDYIAVAAKDLNLVATEAAGFPLSQIAPGRPLPLRSGLNPAWASAMAALQTAAIRPLLGDLTELTEADWVTLLAKLAPYDAWLATKAGASVEKLGLARLRELLAGPAQTALAALIAQDKALETEAAAIATVDRLLHYVRDLHLLCENFVNFKDFYDGGEPAIFQAGTLYLDQRSCTLCLPVEDAARHGTMAGLAGTYLAYLDCVRKGTGEKRSIMAAFTDGDSDNLMVGRNGLFYDRKGKDYDATITKIIDNPISVRQAFWSPFKKLVRLVEDQVAKRAAAADADANAKLAKAAETAANADKAAKEADAKKEEAKKIDVGAVAAMGVAFGALSAAFATIAGYVSGLLDKEFWQICLAVLGLLLIVSGPSMLIAWLKLRKRNLGPILDANGWAVNAKAKVNVPFGTSLTGVAKLPPGALAAKVDDRFAEHAPKWPKFLYAGIAVCFVYSLANHYHFAPKWSAQEGGIVIPALHPTNAPVSVPISGNITGSISGSVTNTPPAK
jgi:hypothetical protein